MKFPSWWLKFDRANQHMVDIKRHVRRYARAHPYEAVRIRYPRRKQDVWRFRLRIVEQPDQQIALILGDAVHNFRSALDHVVVGHSTEKKMTNASFPIESTDPWLKRGRSYVIRNPEVRKRFNGLIAGLRPDVQAFIKEFQPYQTPKDAPRTALFALSSLDNADKHKGLLAIGSGLKDAVVTVTRGGETERIRIRSFLPDGADIPLGRSIFNPKVKVQIRGTAAITIQVVQGGKRRTISFPLLESLNTISVSVGSIIAGVEYRHYDGIPPIYAQLM